MSHVTHIGYLVAAITQETVIGEPRCPSLLRVSSKQKCGPLMEVGISLPRFPTPSRPALIWPHLEFCRVQSCANRLSALPLIAIVIMPKAHSRNSLFTLWFLLLWSVTEGSQVNITVDDFDPSIVYAPPDSWNSSAVVCSVCNNPPALLASQQTYHKGAHVVILDEDDTGLASSPSKPPPPSPSIDNPPTSKNPASKASTAKPPSTSAPAHSSIIPNAVSRPLLFPPPPNESDNDKGAEKPDDDDDDDDRDHDHDDDPSKSHRGRRDRVPRADSDDPGFVDTPVFAQYNFTGELFLEEIACY